MAELKGLTTGSLTGTDILKQVFAGNDNLPYTAMAQMGQAPNTLDTQAENWGEVAKLGANSPTLAGGIIQGFGTGMKMRKSEKAQAQRDEWNQKIQALMQWDVQNKQHQAEVEDTFKTMAGAQQEAQYMGPQLTNGIEQWNSTGDTSSLDGVMSAMPMAQKQLKMADNVPQEARFNKWAEVRVGDTKKLIATYTLPDGQEKMGNVGHTYDELINQFGKPYSDAKAQQELQQRLNDASVVTAEAGAKKAGYEAQLAEAKANDPMARMSDSARAKVEEKNAGRQDVSTVIDGLRGNYLKLQNNGAIVDPKAGPAQNLMAKAGSSAVGQLVGGALGTENQSVRQEIQNSLPLLMASIKSATGMSSQQLNSNAELKFYMQAATDPNKDIKSNLAALDNLEKMFGVSGAHNGQQPQAPQDVQPQGAQPQAEQSKVLNGKTYVKVNGQWYEQ